MSFITANGETKITQKIAANAVLSVTHFVFANITGLGAEPVDRVESLPSSGDIVATRSVSKQGFVNANKVIYSCLLDTTLGDFSFNWVGLKDADGVLIACDHIATTIHKIKTVGATQGNNLARNFLLEFSGAQSITGIDTPADTWQFDFSNRLRQIDDRERESNFDIYGQGSFFDTGFLVAHTSGSSFTVAAGIGYVGGIRCDKASVETMTITGLPKTVYVDASLQGDINGVSAVFSVVASASTLADYVDAQGFSHYIVAIASIASDGTVTDLRKILSKGSSNIIVTTIISYLQNLTDTFKWDYLRAVGDCQPFFPDVIGTDIDSWLAAHPKWRKLNNSIVSDIEGRALAFASTSHVGGSQYGSDTAVLVSHNHTGITGSHHHSGSNVAEHTHDIYDPAHYHTYFESSTLVQISSGANNSYTLNTGTTTTGSSTTGINVLAASPALYIASESLDLYIANAGQDGVNKNIQRTQYLDWIIKVA